MTRTAFVGPAAGQAQLPQILDMLARLSSFASTPVRGAARRPAGTAGVRHVASWSCRAATPSSMLGAASCASSRAGSR